MGVWLSLTKQRQFCLGETGFPYDLSLILSDYFELMPIYAD